MLPCRAESFLSVRVFASDASGGSLFGKMKMGGRIMPP